MSIRHQNTDVKTGLAVDWMPDSDKLVIGFRGLNPGREVRFHFVDLMSDIPVNKVWVRDPDQVWYHHGIAGYTGNIDESAEYLAGLIADRGIERVVSFGASGGAYAALLFGWLLEFDHVIAMSPQTYLGADTDVQDYDYGQKLLASLMASEVAQREYFDLVPLLSTTTDVKGKFQIHYCEAVAEDRFHAERVQGLPGVTLHPRPDGGHRLGMHMIRSGELRSILLDALAMEPDAR